MEGRNQIAPALPSRCALPVISLQTRKRRFRADSLTRREIIFWGAWRGHSCPRGMAELQTPPMQNQAGRTDRAKGETWRGRHDGVLRCPRFASALWTLTWDPSLG